MPRKKLELTQLWRCPLCGAEQEVYIPALEVLCGKQHRKDNRTYRGYKMELVKERKVENG